MMHLAARLQPVRLATASSAVLQLLLEHLCSPSAHLAERMALEKLEWPLLQVALVESYAKALALLEQEQRPLAQVQEPPHQAILLLD